MIVAGEASGDRHAADFFNELRKIVPGVQGFGMGGAGMRNAGVDIRYDSSGIAVIGLDGIVRNYTKILGALRQMKHLAGKERPDLLVCVDYKEFNFKLARAAKAQGIKVLFYISPQYWAWRPGRIVKYGRAVDRMAVIFPFEVEGYEKHGIPVSFVGHPLREKVYPSVTADQARSAHGLGESGRVIGLLPGSRYNEVRRCLPVMLAVAESLGRQYPDLRFVLLKADTVDDEQINTALAGLSFLPVVIRTDPYDVLQCCSAVLTTSGTATLEVALLGVPMVITYKVNRLTYWIGRLLVNIPYIGLPNIIAGRKIVEEFVQDDAKPEQIVTEMRRLLDDPSYARAMVHNLQEVRDRLVGGGAAELARVAAGMLGRS